MTKLFWVLEIAHETDREFEGGFVLRHKQYYTTRAFVARNTNHGLYISIKHQADDNKTSGPQWLWSFGVKDLTIDSKVLELLDTNLIKP